MEKLGILYNVLERAKMDNKELIESYTILSIKERKQANNPNTEIRIKFTKACEGDDLISMAELSKIVDVVIKEKWNLFFIESSIRSNINTYVFETINNLTLEEVIPSFKEVAHNVKEAEKKLDKEVEENNRMENLLTNQINNL